MILIHTIRVNYGVDKDTTLENTHTQNTQTDIWLTWQRGKAKGLVTSMPCGKGKRFRNVTSSDGTTKGLIVNRLISVPNTTY